MTSEIVGRDKELGVLRRFLERPHDRPAGLVLEGEAGIGKSTLWFAGVAAAGDRGLRVISSRPAEAERGLAYAGLGDLLEDVLDEVLPWLALPRRRVLEAALLVEDATEEVDPRALAVAVRSALEVLAAIEPVVIAVDDVHWLDPSSAGALSFALRRLDGPVVVLLARRLADGARPSELERALGDERLERLSVGPLSAGAIHRLLRRQLDRAFARPTLLRIHETSGGNPFYALELARARGPDVDSTQPLPVPTTLAGLLSARLRDLPVETHGALRLASALGNASAALLRAAGVTEAALEPALVAHVIERADGSLRFTHPLLASVVYQGLSAGERRGVHRLVAEIIDDPVARARHLALASDGPDAELGAVLEEAAAVASVRGAPAAAAELGELARRVTPADDRAGRHRRAIVAAHGQLRAGDVRGARARASDLLARTPGGPGRAEALVLLSSVEAGDGELERAIDLRREALREAAAPPALKAAIHQWLGANVRHTEGVRAGERHARASLVLAERLHDDALRAGALAILGLRRFEAGERDALGLAEEAHALAATVTSRQHRVPASSGLAHLLSWSVDRLDLLATFALADMLVSYGRFERARGLLDGLHRDLAARDELLDAEVSWCLSMLEFQAGRWTLAADHAGRAREIKLQYREREEPGILAVLAELAVHRGELEHARELAERGRELAQGQAEFLAWLEAILGLADRANGDPDHAVAHFASAERIGHAAEWGEPTMYWWRADQVEALLELGRVDDAVGLLNAWERDARRLGREWVIAHVTRCRGLVAAARGEVDSALFTLEEAVMQHEAVGDRFGLARALLALGVTRRRARLKRAAREAIEAALGGFEELGAATWTARARVEVGKIGGRTRAEELTAAERRVAALVAEGRTNREVAAALVLGERTVETHLTHIYAKLGLRSRTELARTLGSKA